jgi:hypothetical protein
MYTVVLQVKAPVAVEVVLALVEVVGGCVVVEVDAVAALAAVEVG